IVILANLNLTAFPEAVRAYFLNQLMGIDPETDQKEILAHNVQLKQLLAPPPPPKNPGKFNGTLQSLVGVYENDYYGRCEIVLEGDALKVLCGPAKYPATLKHWNNGAFLMLFPGATQVPSITTFTIGEDGKADSFADETLGTFTRVKEKKSKVAADIATSIVRRTDNFDLTPSELRRLRALKTPAGIQKFLDDLPYNLSFTARSPKSVLHDRMASCLEGGIFGAAALRILGFPPLIFDLEAEQDTDHVVAIFKVRGHWGAVAKSNFTGCRYREPVYRSLRELAMSYFNIYFNLRGERTLRRYSR